MGLFKKNSVEPNFNGAAESEKVIEMTELKTAKDMYDYCIKNNFGNASLKKWGEKHFQLIIDNLQADEKVYMVFVGLHNYRSMTKHDGNYAYAITNKRIIMAQKQLIGEKIITISLENINDIKLGADIFMGTITVDTIKEIFNVMLDKKSAKNINNTIHVVLDKIKKDNSQSEKASSASSVSVADEILKFKNLFDMGAITQEEFEKKKEQLLN